MYKPEVGLRGARVPGEFYFFFLFFELRLWGLVLVYCLY
jgi:hypothetical protein